MRDLVPASSSAIPEPALAPLPDTLLLRSQRPFWGAAARVWVAFALVGAALIFASGALFWALIGLSVVAFFLLPALVLGLLRPIEKEVLAATPKTAPALLDALRNRRRVRLLAPYAWTAAQEGRLHLIRGDGRAAARSFAEALRLGGLAGDPPPSLVSAQAQALLVAEAPEQAREMLQQLGRRGPLGPWERLHLGIALLLGGKLRVEDAREHVDAAQQALGGFARVLAARAWLAQRAGEGETAIAALQAAETALHEHPDKLGQSLVERARRLLRPALKAQEKRARKHDRRGTEVKKSPVVEGAGAKGQVAGREGVSEGAGKRPASVGVRSEAPRAVEPTPAVAEATPAGGIVLALGPGTSAATGEKEAKEVERAKGKKKARREERRAARRAAKAERRATQRTASPARPAVRTSAPVKVVEKAKDAAAAVEKKVAAVKEPRVEAARVEKPAVVEAGVKDRSVAVEKPAAVVATGAAQSETSRVETPAAVDAGVKDRAVEPVAAPASVASRGEGPAGQSGAVAARPAEVAQKTGAGPARAEQAPAPPSGSALFGGLGKAAGEVVATPGVGPGRLPTLRPGTTRPEVPSAGSTPAAPQRASGPVAPPTPAPSVPAVPKFSSPSGAPPKAPAPAVTPPVAQAPVAKSVAPAPVLSAPSVTPRVASAPVASGSVPTAPVATPRVASAPVASAPVPAAPAASAPVASVPVAPVAPLAGQTPVFSAPVAPPAVQTPAFSAPVAPPAVQAPVLSTPVAPPVASAPMFSAPVAPPAVQAPVLSTPPVVRAPGLTSPIAPPAVQAQTFAAPVAAPQPSAPTPQAPSDVSGAGDAEWDALLDAFDET